MLLFYHLSACCSHHQLLPGYRHGVDLVWLAVHSSAGVPSPLVPDLHCPVPASRHNHIQITGVFDTLDGIFMGAQGALLAAVDVITLESIVQSAGPHVDGVLKCAVQDWHGVRVGASLVVGDNVIQAHLRQE